MTMRMTTGVYDLANVGFCGVSVDTTTADDGVPGRGRPEAAVAIERAVDLFAAEIGLDPVEVRRRNLVRRSTTATRPRSAPATTSATTPGRSTGRWRPPATGAAGRAGAGGERPGIRSCSGSASSVYVEITAGAGGLEYGSVELRHGGRIRVASGSTPFGQGHDTAWSMIVADRTGVPMERHRGRARGHRAGAPAA